MITAIVCVVVGTAHADSDPVFDAARMQLEKGDFKRGCPTFEKLYEASQNPGIEANLARCAEHDGDLTRAWRLFTSAAEKWAGDERADQMRAKAAGVAKDATWVVLGVPDPALPGISVTINGRSIEPKREVRELVKPGEITLTAKATGKSAWRREVTGKAGESVVVEVMLADKPDDEVVDETAPAIVRTTRTQRRRSRVYISIGMGVAAIAAFATSYVVAKKASDDYDETFDDPMYCTNNTCTPQGQKLIDDAQRRATLGTWIGVAGGALAVGAAVVFFTAPRDTIVTPTVSSTGGGLSFSTRF